MVILIPVQFDNTVQPKAAANHMYRVVTWWLDRKNTELIVKNAKNPFFLGGVNKREKHAAAWHLAEKLRNSRGHWSDFFFIPQPYSPAFTFTLGIKCYPIVTYLITHITYVIIVQFRHISVPRLTQLAIAEMEGGEMGKDAEGNADY